MVANYDRPFTICQGSLGCATEAFRTLDAWRPWNSRTSGLARKIATGCAC